MAYADPNTYTITLNAIANQQRDSVTQYGPLAPATASTPNSIVLVPSSLFSGDVFVEYDFSIVPSYDVPAGSTFTISFPSPEFDHMFSSSPPAVCNLLSDSYLGTCTNTTAPNEVTFLATADIEAATPLEMSLTGLKNPTFVGTLPAGSITLDITHPTGYLINSDSFSDLTFSSPKSADNIFMVIDLTSNFKLVDADYTFTL
mmetsp:Transcript_13854/g.11827  ORF Transcript_13854/g.11827 Transcript_13854/m.11827 type:complete len:202 (+) Transcript_13854:6469-7074(+)